MVDRVTTTSLPSIRVGRTVIVTHTITAGPSSTTVAMASIEKKASAKVEVIVMVTLLLLLGA